MISMLSLILLYFPIVRSADTTSEVPSLPHLTPEILNETRRILKGKEVTLGTRPYMVYLKPSLPNDDPSITKDWLCGGVIVHESYILTSAACIENVQQFYVVSGTHSWYADGDDECIKYGQTRAMWKCVLKNYNYDGKDFDNINWMHHDIAVVRVEDNFNFEKRVRGCDFIPGLIAYNNKSEDLERPKTMGSVAGWGSTKKFGDPILDVPPENSQVMLETDVRIISKKACKAHWPERYHYIIDDRMICTQDIMNINVDCADKVDCKEIIDETEYDEDNRRVFSNKENWLVHSGHPHNSVVGRRTKMHFGGFCENDHGGPLVVGQGMTATVVGIITACLVRDVSRTCYGPFLYTSVYKNRFLISCAIYKEDTETCRSYLREGGLVMVRTAFIWPKGHQSRKVKVSQQRGKGGKKSMPVKENSKPGEAVAALRQSEAPPTVHSTPTQEETTKGPTTTNTVKISETPPSSELANLLSLIKTREKLNQNSPKEV